MTEKHPPDLVRFLLGRLRLGFRTAFLLLIGTVEIVYGAGLIVASRNHPDRLHWWPGNLHSLVTVPVLAWGVVWCCCGAFMLGALFSLPRLDRVQFAVAAALNGTWAALAVERAVASGEDGAWAPAAIYGGISVAILIISAWPEPAVIIPEDEIVTRAETVRNGDAA